MMYYTEGDKVVIRDHDKYCVGIVTNVRRHKGSIAGYDVRTERGSGLVCIGIDKPKSVWTIESTLTKVWNENTSEPTKMFYNARDGHTRANYAFGSSVNFDEDRHMEKCNDYSFPVVGDRSW